MPAEVFTKDDLMEVKTRLEKGGVLYSSSYFSFPETVILPRRGLSAHLARWAWDFLCDLTDWVRDARVRCMDWGWQEVPAEDGG